MPETVSRKSSWPISTCLSIISLPVVSFALISSELRPMAMLTPMARDLGVTEGAAGQVEVLTLFPGIAAPTVAVVIPQSEPLRSGYRWRQGTGPVPAGRLRPPRTATFFEAEQVLALEGIRTGAPLFGHAITTICRFRIQVISPPSKRHSFRRSTKRFMRSIRS